MQVIWEVYHNSYKYLTAKYAKDVPMSQRVDIQLDNFSALCVTFAILAV
jgi:hypothetical protein